MSVASSTPRQFVGRPLSCISGRDAGSDCGEDNWDKSAGSGFYTVCCNGDIIDITGFNSWANYTLLLKNLVCCSGEDPQNRGMSFDETKGCLDGPGKPLSALLATSTDVAQPWILETAGKTSTINPECFWSLPPPGEESSTTETPTRTSASASAVPVLTSGSSMPSASAASSPASSLLASTSQSILSSTYIGASSSATTTMPVSSSSNVATTSSAETAQGSDAVSTGLAAAIVLPRWSLPLFLLLSLGLNM
jgi:hypothetical protein